jgi:hypothetical protein
VCFLWFVTKQNDNINKDARLKSIVMAAGENSGGDGNKAVASSLDIHELCRLKADLERAAETIKDHTQ